MAGTRRRFLGLAGVGTGLALAGCLGDEASGTPTDGNASADDDSNGSDDADADTDDEATDDQTTSTTMSTVFHFTSGGESNQRRAISNISNLLADETTDLDELVVVVNAAGIDLLVDESSTQRDEVVDLIDEGVSFRLCENTMESRELTDDDLIDGVETVPAGVGELTKLQARDGFAYIKTP
ncbi:DsrE family protein [Haloferacaceae archaeon DSL9]